MVALTLAAPLVETTHWTADLMARASGISASAVRRIWKAHGLQPHRYRQFKLSNDPNFVDKLRDVVGLYVDPPAHAIVLSLMAPRPCSLRSTSSTGPSKENHALRLRMLRRQKPLDDFAHACFYFCAQGTCLAPIHWTSGADRRRVARCGFMSSFGSLYCRSLTWCLALLISRQSLMCGGPRRSRVFSRNERGPQNQRGRCGYLMRPATQMPAIYPASTPDASSRREARGPSGHAADQVRVGDQPQHGKNARPRNSAHLARRPSGRSPGSSVGATTGVVPRMCFSPGARSIRSFQHLLAAGPHAV